MNNYNQPLTEYTHEITKEQKKWLKANYPEIKILYSRKPYTNERISYVTQSTKELIEREMPEPAVGLRKPITEDQFESYHKNSTIFELEQQIEDLQSTLILQKSKAKVLISYYKDRAKLDQAILKLEEEIING